MAMSKCKECGKSVSTLARTCPSCGVPKPATEFKAKKKISQRAMAKNITPNIKNSGKSKWKGNTNTVYVVCSNKRCSARQTVKLYKKVKNKSCGACLSKYEKLPIDKYGRAYHPEVIINKTSDPSPPGADLNWSPPSYNKNNNENSDDENSFDRLLNGELDLATAFWGYGVAGTMIVGFICGWLSGTYSKWFTVPYIIFAALVIKGLFECAATYKEEQKKKNQSEVWGFLVQAVCVMSGFGLFTLINDTFF